MLPLIKNNLKLILAKKGTLFILLILPVILFSLGLLNNQSANFRLRIGVKDEDDSVLSRSLTQSMTRDGNLVEEMEQEDWGSPLLDGSLEAIVLVPAGLEASMMAGETPQVVIRTLKGQEIVGALQASINMHLSSMAAIKEIDAPSTPEELVDAMARAEAQGTSFHIKRITSKKVHQGLSFASGFLFYVFAMSMMQATGLILEERQWNTLNRIRQAPVGRFSYVLSSIITAMIFLLMNLLALLIVSTFLFQVKTTPVMYLLWFYYGLIWIAFGVFLALVAKSRAVHTSIVPIVTTIFAMLGGSFWPLWLMPAFMQKVAMITPQYWANDAMQLIQHGQSLLAQGTDLLALTGFLLLFFALSVFALRRMHAAETFL